MFQNTKIEVAADAKQDTILPTCVSKVSAVKGPVFIIGSWQTGDFPHIYAAAVHHFSVDPGTPFAILVLQAQGFGVAVLLEDIRVALAPLCAQPGRSLTLFWTDPIRSKNTAVAVMGELMKLDNAREPYDATFWAAEAVKSMKAGQPLTPVWASLTRGESPEHTQNYADVCGAFMQDYIAKFGVATGRARFVCLWDRTSGAPLPTRPLGGANPQYDSSRLGNHQLSEVLHRIVPRLTAVMLVGEGFDDATRRLSYVFDLGAFWKKLKSVKGRFQENGFFDYVTAVYDCDVVHVGMKSGGMDTLGIWGQKVVFIDSERAHPITKARVAAWSTENILPVEIGAMPTALGKAIEDARDEDARAFKTTFGSKKQVEAMEQRAAAKKFDDSFARADLEKVARAVDQMFD